MTSEAGKAVIDDKNVMTIAEAIRKAMDKLRKDGLEFTTAEVVLGFQIFLVSKWDEWQKRGVKKKLPHIV